MSRLWPESCLVNVITYVLCWVDPFKSKSHHEKLQGHLRGWPFLYSTSEAEVTNPKECLPLLGGKSDILDLETSGEVVRIDADARTIGNRSAVGQE